MIATNLIKQTPEVIITAPRPAGHEINLRVKCCVNVNELAPTSNNIPGCCGYAGWGPVVATGFISCCCVGACFTAIAAYRSGVCCDNRQIKFETVNSAIYRPLQQNKSEELVLVKRKPVLGK